MRDDVRQPTFEPTYGRSIAEVLVALLGRLLHSTGLQLVAKDPGFVITDELLVDAFAKALWDPDRARAFLWRIKFPVEHIPAFHTPGAFWSLVVDAAQNGAIKGNASALAEAAAARFPGNDIFARYDRRCSRLYF